MSAALLAMMGGSTSGGAPARITFTDNFTGTNGDAPNARWTQETAGWTIQGNALQYAGGSYGYIFATCTSGDNDIQVTWPAGVGGSSYAQLVIRYVDASNYVALQKDSAQAEKMRLVSVTAGTVTEHSIEASATGGGAGSVWRVKNVGNALTAYISGTEILTGTSTAHTSATKIAMSMNTSHSADTMDGFILA